MINRAHRDKDDKRAAELLRGLEEYRILYKDYERNKK